MNNKLTPERLFSEPALRLEQPSQYKISPCANYVSFLRANAQRSRQLDLWLLDRASQQERCLLNAAAVTDERDDDVTKLSPAERAERERRRQFTQGVTEYFWCPHANALVACIDGQAYYVSVDLSEITRLTDADKRQSAFTISSNGSYISYVRNGELYFRRLSPETAPETRVSFDATATVTNGLADFLAAEEMHRFNGHWWSPDESLLFFCKVDETPVAISNRTEVDARGSHTIEQRYPFAGATNPSVALWQYHVNSGEQQQIWQDSTEYAYLARVNAFSDGLYIQCQDRLQQTLTILYKDYAQPAWTSFFVERSATWVNLTDDLTEASNGRIIFTSEANGPRQAIVLSKQKEPKSLHGPSHINQVLAVDQLNLFVCGWDETPTENHLFALSLEGDKCEKLTKDKGWHDLIINPEHSVLLDRFTSDHTPLRVTLQPARGSDSGNSFDLFEEVIDAQHPYHPFIHSHVSSQFDYLPGPDKQPLHYRLTPPLNPTGKHPVIVYVYGGPGAQKVRREWSPLLLQLFAHHGFGVLELDNRGSTNRGRDFEAPIYRAMGSVEVDDQLLGIAMLKDVAWADLGNLGIFGHSYGGYMTLMSLCKAPNVFKAGVAVAPVSDWRLYDSHYTERYMGLPEENAEAYQQSSVIAHLAELSNPLLLMHGMADDNVLFSHSTLIMSELQKLGKTFDLMTYPGAKHSMQERHVSIHRFTTILEFFTRHLQAEINV